MRDDYFSVETSQNKRKAHFQNKNQMKYDSFYRTNNNENYPDAFDQQIRHLQEVRQVLLRTRENINIKMKKVRYRNYVSEVFLEYE